MIVFDKKQEKSYTGKRYPDKTARRIMNSSVNELSREDFELLHKKLKTGEWEIPGLKKRGRREDIIDEICAFLGLAALAFCFLAPFVG